MKCRPPQLADDEKSKNLKKNEGQCTTGPTATTVVPSTQLVKKFWHTVQNIYIVGSVLLVSNFMQKIKKMCHGVQKIFLKKSIFGPKFDLLTSGGPGQEFS